MMSTSRKTVFIGMSGGVDSSVAALLLKKKGYDVVGVFMRCYNLDGCAERDAEDARRVAEHIGIPFYAWDFEREYKKRVVEYMIDGYRAGITPNPDVMCNREIKFGLFLKKALSMGADYVATGHYVKLKIEKRKQKETFRLFAAKDKNKDQSYFLWTLTQDQLRYCLFPIGDYLKPAVRVIARRAKLPTADKKDSQGVCFLGDVDVFDFLKKYIPSRRGVLVTAAGEQIGEHFGSEFYTIGQRHIDADFKFPKTHGAVPRKPFYVAAKDTATNTVIVAEGDENPALYKKEVVLTSVHSADPLLANLRKLASKGAPVFARVRYRQPLAKAKLFLGSRGRAKLIFEHAQKFVAPGQSAVWYSKNGELLGGGIISSSRGMKSV
jgi:tRNA-specific 2-thiouridylase